MGPVIAAVYNSLLALLNSRIARSFITRWFIKLVLLVVIPLCILKGFNYILAQVVAFQVAEMQHLQPTQGISVSSMSGLASYLYVSLGLNIAMGSVFSALSFRWVINACRKGYGMLHYF